MIEGAGHFVLATHTEKVAEAIRQDMLLVPSLRKLFCGNQRTIEGRCSSELTTPAAAAAASQPNRGPRGSIRVITGFNRLVADTPGIRLFLIQWLEFWCWCRSRLTISI